MTNGEYIIIKGHGSISPLGHTRENIKQSYLEGQSAISLKTLNQQLTPIAALSRESEETILQVAQENKNYASLDKTVLMAIYAARQAVKAGNWFNEHDIAVNIGSSRGATGLFEQHFTQFMQTGLVSPAASPVTTLGNISSWVANDIEAFGPSLSHSVTCSTALQAIANGFAWLKAGMAQKYLAGGAEAPLTPFTVAQMKAIGIYASSLEKPYYCRPLNQERENTFVLGEGAAVFALEKVKHKPKQGEIILEAIGFGFEKIKSKTGISVAGQNFQTAITQTLNQANSSEPIDLIIMHAPGTVAGDAAEINALKAIFGEENLPVITSNKFLIGHTLGASAALSIEYALHILQEQHFLSFPYPTILQNKTPGKIKRILVSAAGFGGNAAALLLRSCI